jgi:isoleucyl-tRNA synthetase
VFDGPSYLNCVCLGLILDPEGQKMSKSRGNVVEPAEVIDSHGADALRWYYFTSQQPWAGYRFSAETVGESVRQFLLTLWNTYSFWVLYAGTEGFGPEEFRRPAHPHGEIHAGRATSLDRWAISRLQHTIEVARERLDNFDSTLSGGAIAAYVDELSNWYVRLSRRRFWEADRNAFATLRYCLVETAKLLAPFTPFLADEIYRNLVGGESGDFGEAPDSVHLCDFPTPDAALIDDELEAAMDAVRRTVELGRAARAQAKVKMRQPLHKAVIVATEVERAAIEAESDLVKAELNVKELDFVHQQSELVSYRVRPNYRALGPRFGKQMPQVAAAVESLDASHVSAALDEGRDVGVNVDGSEHTLAPEDISLQMEPLEGYEVEAEAGHAVALQLELDEELLREGLAREVVHAVQNARRDAGLDVSDRIELRLGGDEELLAAAREHEDYVAGETLATGVGYEDADADAVTATIEGRELRIGVVKSG